MILRARRGSALILVLMMTLAIAGLSIAAIFMSSSAGLLSAFYDREREFQLAAESALEIARARLRAQGGLVVPDTGVVQLVSGEPARDARGTVIGRVRVNVFAAITGDTTGLFAPTITLVAAAYDASGTRHVQRMDLRRESLSRYGLFVDSFPSTAVHGPGVVPGRVHVNGTWRGSSSENLYRDTVSATAAVTGTGTFELDSVVGVPRVTFPRDSTFPRLDTLAAAAALAFTPVSGGGRGSRLEFVALDADGDGVVERHEGFVRIFDLAASAGVDTLRLRGAPRDSVTPLSTTRFYAWNDPIVQNQCGAFYLRGGRWHFFPVATHRASWAENVIRSMAAQDYPQVSNARMGVMQSFGYDAAEAILSLQPTARCFPAGSPFLMPTERMTDPGGVVRGDARDSIPWGVAAPPGGWPASAPLGYGGSDTTFTPRSRTCRISSGTSGRCASGTLVDLGTWRAFGGTAVTTPDSVRQAVERPYLWPISAPLNASSRGVVSSRAGPLYVSGTVRGRVTLRVNGRVALVDRLVHQADPGAVDGEVCDNQLGVVATGDILVVSSFLTRTRLIGRTTTFAGLTVLAETDVVHAGREPRFRVDANLLSTAGTVGVESPGEVMGGGSSQYPCPDNGAVGSYTNGGCLVVTGGMAMRTYSPVGVGGSQGGFRYAGVADRCQTTARRPPFFPVTNRYTFVRSLEVDATQANTPTKIRSLLLRLKGRAL